MATKNPVAVGGTDPAVLRNLETQLAQASALARGKITVIGSETVFPQSTATATNTTVSINTSTNNDPIDTVTVTPVNGNVYVSSIDQTVKRYTVTNLIGGNTSYIANGSSYANIATADGNLVINVGSDGHGIWTFVAGNGNLVGPGNASQGAGIVFSADQNVYIREDMGDLYIDSGSTITITTNSGNVGNTQDWTFGADGTTIFPTLTVQRGDNPSGTITGQTLLFGDAAQEAIISTAAGTVSNENSQRLVINPGQGYDYGEGGDIYLWAGRGGDGSGSGGDIKIRGGQGGANTTGGSGGDGGYIRIEAGDSATTGGAPGYIDINAGINYLGAGGYVDIQGGQGHTIGGDANITGGYGYNVRGGNVNIWGGGSGNGQINEGNVNIQTGGNTWTFDPSGNLTLPTNTFAVNYANGTQVSIGGSGNTGNVTFDDNIVIGTGDEYGGAGLFLATGPNGVANLQYLQVRGGDFPTHIHLDTGNNAFYDQYFGADSRYVKLEANGNVVINADDYAGNGATWTLDTTGNLSLPAGGSIYSEGFTPSGNPGNTITLNPHGSGSITNQKLLVYPTAGDGDHIHLTSGNLYQTELFLGNDNFFVRLANTGNIIINSDDDAGNTAQWKFGIDGNLTASGNLIIAGNTNVFGTVSALIQPTDDKPLLALSSGANGAVSSVWVEDVANVGTSNIAAVYANPIPGSGIVRIAVGQNGGNTGPSLWDFGTDGNLTIPGGGAVWSLGTGTSGLTANFADPYNVNLGLDYTTNTATLAGANSVVIQSNTGANTKQWTFNANGATSNPVILYATLPAPTTLGLRAFISDSNLALGGNFGAEISGGGGNYVPVFSDGANWCIG